MAYRLTPRAERHFTVLLEEIAEHPGWSRSMRVEELLYDAFRLIGANPGVGHLRRDILPRDIYVHYAAPYMVLYRRDKTPVSIIGIFHGARDIAALTERDL